MQISVIISVLAIATMAYGFNIDIWEKIWGDLAACNKLIFKAPDDHNVPGILCTLIRDGEILDKNGEFKNEIAMQRLEDLISNPNKLEQARQIHIDCHREVVKSGATGIYQTKQIILCERLILTLFDKI
ncbi:uncharacterized protein LOC116851936 [Odontomachus brunneus]|uniref:uncharacterized protein LOC116851936 n=1 Tax=Odontomachus brunneus TaxID=486640 RepID=UPI0013F26B6C|nr:uncharacterized protein LOC116851936 [Odontomachus brunneus]